MVGLIPVSSAIFLEFNSERIITYSSSEEVMFSLCLFACLFAILHKKYSINLHRIQSKDGTWAVEKLEILVLFQITLC